MTITVPRWLAALAAGLVVLALAAFTAKSRVWRHDSDPLALSAASAMVTWPPAPTRIINLSSVATMNPGDVQSVYQVPLDAWLVVTDADKVSVRVDIGDFGVMSQGGYQHLLNATDFFDGYHSATGIAFAPGSQVAVANQHPSLTQMVWWDITGYLVPHD